MPPAVDATPLISVVIPTLNAERVLDDCLRALREQDHPRSKLEIILVDAGSTDATLEIARRHEVDRVLPNPLLTGEAGKAVGMKAARGELILLVDSDNIVIGRDWVSRMVRPFAADPAVVGAEPQRWHHRAGLGWINRWHALSGVADPLTLYVGNYARDSQITGRWTDFAHGSEPRDGWDRITLDPRAVPVLGANGFMLRSAVMERAPIGDYHFDLDYVHDLVEQGDRVFARVDVPVEHRFCEDVSGYWRKTRRRADDFFAFQAEGRRTYPWTRRRTAGIADFALSTILLAPVLRDALRGYRRRPDTAWAFHPLACLLTLAVYSAATVRGRLRPRMLDRSQWRQ
jgi:glycosyltransferase involved in cell wall biosynthesis